jgi:hypothetical protein
MLEIESNFTKTLSLQSGRNLDLRLFISKNRQGNIEMEIHELSPLGFDSPGTFLDVLTMPVDWIESNYSPNVGFDIGGGCRMELGSYFVNNALTDLWVTGYLLREKLN